MTVVTWRLNNSEILTYDFYPSQLHVIVLVFISNFDVYCAKYYIFNKHFSYYSSVNELLTAIKKTEDSLQRLKQQRKAVTGQWDASTGTKTNEISDENKIRKQIYLDAEEFGKQVGTLLL